MKATLTISMMLLAWTGCDGSTVSTTDAGTSPGTDGGAPPPVDAGPSTGPDGAVGRDAGPPDGCWQAASIPDLSAWGNAGAAYPDPEVSAACEGDQVVMHSNGIPTFEYVAITPNGLAAHDYTWRFPRNPAPAAAPSDVPLLGAAAVTVTGLPIFGPTENPMDGYRDPFLDDMLRNLLDECNGHTAPGGTYHFHARPECIVTSLGGERRGLVIGWSFDGYPILAPIVCEDASCATTRRVSSSWRLTLSEYTTTTRGPAWDIHEYVDGLGDLDECNGLAIVDPDAAYDYAYFATDTFPYFMGCYHGTPTANSIGGGGHELADAVGYASCDGRDSDDGPTGDPLGALACIALLGPVLLSGCILDRSGTQRSRTGLDGSVPEMDAGRADGGVVGRDATTPDAGPPPECSAGDARTVPCGGCGSLTERCEGGGWVATGPCEEMPSCPAGMVETEMEACGSCGTHSRTRTCGGCDGWGDWTPFGACAGEGDCAPGDVRTISESCACDRGTRTVTDSCNASCTWDRSTGACSQQTCGTLFGDVCPNDRAWRPCTMSLRARQCRCDGNSGDFVDCDNSTC